MKSVAYLLLFAAVSGRAAQSGDPGDVAGPKTVRVTDVGATGDGVSDDSKAVLRAVEQLPPEGGIVFFPAGSYLLTQPIPINARNAIIFRGVDSKSSTLTSDRQGLCLAIDVGSARAQKVVFEDVSFKLSENSAIALRGAHVASAEIRRCRIWNGHGVTLEAMNNVTIADCSFESPGMASYSCLMLKGACRNVQIKQNRFSYFRNGIMAIAAPGGSAAHDVMIDRNYFDGGWWLLAAGLSGSGPTVTYTSTTLTDAAARFENVEPATTVRIMPKLAEGDAAASEKALNDPQAQFKKAGLRSGDIIRFASVFGVVAQVESENSLRVEDWVSESDRHVVDAPAGAYVAFGIYLGRLTSAAGKTLQVVRWHDFDGRSLTPAPGTRYEIAVSKPNYPIHFVRETRAISVTNNVLVRGWSDQISIYGSGCTVAANTVRDGQDMGITIQDGSHNRVVDNVVSHQGTNEIGILHSDDNVIMRNRCSDAMWVSQPSAAPTYGDIVVYEGNRNKLIKNVVERGTCTNDRHGIVIYSSGKQNFTAIANEVRDNMGTNHGAGEFIESGSRSKNTIFLGNTVLRGTAGPSATAH